MSVRDPADYYRRVLGFGGRFGGPAALSITAALSRIQLQQLEDERSGRLPAAWSSPLVPSEILHSFGLASVTPETVTAILASAGLGGKLLEAAGAEFLSGDCCSFQTTAVAALMEGYVPVPEAFISTSPICDENPKMCDYLSFRFGRKYFLLDIPGADDDAARRYVLSQLKELILFLEDLTGRRFDPAALARAVDESNRARRHWEEANRLRMEHPPVMYGGAALRMAGGMLLQKLGLPSLADATATYVKELQKRIKNKDFLPVKKRLLWLHLFPLYDRGFMPYVESDLGLVVVFEESSLAWWEEIDPGDPLPGLAGRILSNPLTGPVSRRIESVLQMARDFRVDGVVNFSHLGCKALSGGAPFVGAALRDAGIPFLDLSGDCLDNRSRADAPWRSRLEAFSEMLG